VADCLKVKFLRGVEWSCMKVACGRHVPDTVHYCPDDAALAGSTPIAALVIQCYDNSSSETHLHTYHTLLLLQQ
jgi:hypothetical protein